jgi:hypothetical protein
LFSTSIRALPLVTVERLLDTLVASEGEPDLVQIPAANRRFIPICSRSSTLCGHGRSATS